MKGILGIFLSQNLNLPTFFRPEILATLKSALRKVNIITACTVSYQVTKLPSYQVIKLLRYQATKLPSYQSTTKLLSDPLKCHCCTSLVSFQFAHKIYWEEKSSVGAISRPIQQILRLRYGVYVLPTFNLVLQDPRRLRYVKKQAGLVWTFFNP